MKRLLQREYYIKFFQPVEKSALYSAANKKNVFFLTSTFFSLLVIFNGQGQSLSGDASHIYTDYNGYWSSGIGAISGTKPDNSHNLLGFTWENETYSTGVNDAQLVSSNVVFTPAEYQAFPVNGIQSTSSTYIGWGQMKDGVDNGISPTPPFPVPPTLANYLTDGQHGLDIGTGVANIKAGNLVFNFTGIIDRNQIADGAPDILVSQIANPSSTSDVIYLADADGNRVGNELSISYSTNASLGEWTADFYHLNGTQATFVNEDRDLWLWGAELSAFGINDGNYQRVKQMVYRLNGSSDPAFAAYKVGVFDIISANDDEAESETGEAVEINILENDQPTDYLDPATVTLTAAPDYGTVTIDPTTGVVTYLPDADFSGIDVFEYQVCSNASDADLCDVATVQVTVRAADLPIELLNFSATLSKDEQVKVEWTTAGEVNNDYFEIQHSSNGRDWKVLEKINGAGNSSANMDYSIIDPDPVQGYNYYRLKQVDNDGNFTLFEVVSLKLQQEIRSNILVFPNPNYGRITLEGAPSELEKITVINAFGQIQEHGLKIIRLSGSKVQINLETLPNGMYIVRTATMAQAIQKR